MKPILMLLTLSLSSLALAATDPCKLLAPGEVKAGLGSPPVKATTATDQDIPTCTFGFEGGALSLGVTAGAQKMLRGQSLLAMLRSGEGGEAIKGIRSLPGLGDEAAGAGGPLVTKVGASSITQDFATMYVRKGDRLLVFMAVSNDHAASRLNMQSLALLVKRALLRLP